MFFETGGSGSRLVKTGRKVRTPQDTSPMFAAWDSAMGRDGKCHRKDTAFLRSSSFERQANRI
jgi:hypothetical protein